MNKKYQVFVSSTYQDLVDERKQVIQAILELDCIPVGMELFPAANEDQWTLIKELIDDCDYYVLIIGGRYGSLSKEGISYTQKEYEYAVEQGIPTISFLHKTPDSIPVSKTDKSDEKRILLENFKAKVTEKMIKHWENADELGSVVSRSLVKLTKSNPRIGWVRADKISGDEANLEILRLKERILELENEKKQRTILNTEHLSKGQDLQEVEYLYKKIAGGNVLRSKIKISWENLFSKSCTILIDEGTETAFHNQLNAYIKHILTEEKTKVSEVNIVKESFKVILIQFKALGLIKKSEKRRSLKDNSTYWTLTEEGDRYLTELRAIHKTTTTTTA